jgi:acyl-CoA synthetase (NDP forming)
LRSFGYQGEIYGVNPRYTTLDDGRPCYPSLNDLPEQPDCALLAIPNERLLDAMRDVGDRSIPSAVIFANAYGHGADGRTLQESLAAIACEHNIAVCGPNCMGFISFQPRLAVSGYPVLDAPAGHVALISHSGSIWESVIQNNRQLTFNYAISSGNEMVTTLADYLLFVLDDPQTRVVGLFLETVRDPQRFRLALETAAERDIPIVALKAGRSERGARMAQAHSGALAGSAAVYDALFTHYGVVSVQSPDEMMDTLELFSAGYRPPTPFLAAVHDSGGERALLVDLAAAQGVEFARLEDSTKARLAAVLEPGLEPENPVDAWGTGNGVTDIYETCALALDADPNVGLTLFAVDLMRASTLPPTYPDIVLPIRGRFSKPLAFLVNVTAAAGEDQLAQLRGAGVPVLMGAETGTRAVGHLLAYAEKQRSRQLVGAGQPRSNLRHEEPASLAAASPAEMVNGQWSMVNSQLDEYAGKQLLAAYGIPVTAEAIAKSLDQARYAAEQIGYPVVLKTAAPGILHKSEVDGIRLNLATSEQLAAAYSDLAGRLGSRVLVQEMVSGGVELILGIVNDAQFGLLLLVGLGGVWAEVLDDTKLLLLPTTAAAVKQALRSLHGVPLLLGARGRPPANLEAVVEAALSLARVAADYADQIQAIDINPLVARPDGVVVVDALVIGWRLETRD